MHIEPGAAIRPAETGATLLKDVADLIFVITGEQVVLENVAAIEGSSKVLPRAPP